MECRKQTFQLLAISLSEDFNGAIPPVSRPSSGSNSDPPVNNKGAKANPLDPTVDDGVQASDIFRAQMSALAVRLLSIEIVRTTGPANITTNNTSQGRNS